MLSSSQLPEKKKIKNCECDDMICDPEALWGGEGSWGLCVGGMPLVKGRKSL